MTEKHPKYDWWMSVRGRDCFNDKTRRVCDVMYGVITLFKFSKTYYRLRKARYQSKKHHGLRPTAKRLSHRLKIDGPRAVRYHFTPHFKTVKGIMFHKKLWKKPRKHTVKYGRRERLIMQPRYDRAYRKYGPLGG